MDSVCEVEGPQEPSKGMECAITDIQKEVAEFPAVANVECNEADVTPTVSEPPRKEPVSVPDGRITATAPKPGTKSHNICDGSAFGWSVSLRVEC